MAETRKRAPRTPSRFVMPTWEETDRPKVVVVRGKPPSQRRDNPFIAEILKTLETGKAKRAPYDKEQCNIMTRWAFNWMRSQKDSKKPTHPGVSLKWSYVFAEDGVTKTHIELWAERAPDPSTNGAAPEPGVKASDINAPPPTRDQINRTDAGTGLARGFDAEADRMAHAAGRTE